MSVRCRHFERLLEGAGRRSGGLLDHSISGSIHYVLRARRNDLGLRGRTPESGVYWPFSTGSIKGRVVFFAVGAAGWGGRTTVKNRLKVSAAGAGRVWASMVGSSVVEGAEVAEGVFGLASWCDVAEAPAISVLSILVRGVGLFNSAGSGEKSNRGPQGGLRR